MQLGMIGLGRMDANMVRRVAKAGHQCVIYDMRAEAIKALAQPRVIGPASLKELIIGLSQRRAIVLMMLASAIDEGKLVPVISTALFGRFQSRGNAGYADRLLSAIRKKFDGHNEKKKEDN